GDVSLRAQACIGLGNARYTDSSHQHNTNWYLEALNLLGKDGDVSLRAQACIGLGNARYTDSSHSREDWYLEALNLLGKDGDVTLHAQTLIGLGNAHSAGYENAKAIAYYEKAQKILPHNSELWRKIGQSIQRCRKFM